MNVVVTFAALAVIFFVSSYITRRRFGLLGLALAAGSLLSGLWGENAGFVVSALGIFPSGPLTTAITLSAIVLLPALILLFHGYAYKTTFGRVYGALLFTIVALAFLVQPLGYALPLQGFGVNAYDWLVQNKDLIIGGGMVIAVFDLFLTKPAHLAEKKLKH